MNRRELLKVGLCGSAAMLHLSGLNLDTWAFDDNNQQGSPPVTPFQVDLTLPAFKTPVPAASLPGAPIFNDGIPTDYFSTTQQQALVQILPGKKTLIGGYDGAFPGPTFPSRLNRRMVVRQFNNLPVNVNVHHHGGHTQSASDGSALPDLEIPPGQFRDYIYDNDDDVGATHWYHDHTLDFTVLTSSWGWQDSYCWGAIRLTR